ncbi:MAG: NAD(P)/FAD-dependent oxidoreductase [Chrysiogenetes bacterium]|nr:NAD(P)/FAD-dependent oxidoreductase [Chrysiogenetes bacterium]
MADRLKTLESDEFDVVVIGSGMGGLCAAGILAKRGKKVLVIEQHYVAGGNSTIFSRKGYEFDVGIHYIGDCEPNGSIPRILRAAGVTDVEFEEMDPNGYDTIVLPDMEFKFPRGAHNLERALIKAFPREKKGIKRYIKFLRQISAIQKVPGNPISALWVLPRSGLLMRNATKTFKEFLDSCTSDVRLQAIMAGQSGDYAAAPSKASALIGGGLTAHYLKGAYFPKGGGQIMSDKLAEAIEENGGKILLMTKAEKIEIENGKVTGVTFESKRLGRRTVKAPVVISNADIRHTIQNLVDPEHLEEKTLKRTARYEMAPGLGVVYLGIDRDLKAEGHPRTNYWIFPSPDQEPFYAAVERGEILDEPFAFISIASVKDPTNKKVAPEGITNMQVMSLAPCQPEFWGVTEEEVRTGAYQKNETYKKKKEEYAAAVLKTAKRVFPDLEEHIVYKEVSTPLSSRRYTGSETSYGIASTPRQFLNGRPPAQTEVEGLLLCGASTRSGHGIGGVTMSGLQAAAQVLGKDLIKEVMGRANRV